MRISVALAALLLAACAAPDASPSAKRSGSGAVATDAPIATEVGADVLRRGGNAVDSAIAVAFALAVVLPEAGNLGGGGYLVARVDGKTWALDFRETAPAAATRGMYRSATGSVDAELSLTGHRAAGVPGSVAGLWEAHRALATRPWRELLEPAIRLAREGFVVDDALAAAIGAESGRLRRFPASSALYLPRGAPLRAGERLRNPDLAATLERIAERGPAGFYEGETAELVAAEMARGGGLVTRDDLRAYRAVWRAPIEFEYRGRRVASAPLSSSGGVTLAMICALLEPYDLGSMPWHSAGEAHLVVEAMRRAFAARNAFLGDPAFVPDATARLLSPRWISAQRATIRDGRATPSLELAPAAGDDGAEGSHTTHFSVADAAGNAVALTTTLNTGFGSAVTVEGAGFLLNNEMDDFAASPGEPNYFSLVQGDANAIAPGKRMLSSMTPVIVTDREGRVVLAAGAAGGPTITTAVFQILSNVVDHGMDVAAAVSAPRLHHQHLPDAIRFEPGAIDDAARARLEAMGHVLESRRKIADAQAVGVRGGATEAAADPRRAGSAARP